MSESQPSATLAPARLVSTQDGLVKAVSYFKGLDLRRFKKPTKHTAHQSTEQLNKRHKPSNSNTLPA